MSLLVPVPGGASRRRPCPRGDDPPEPAERSPRDGGVGRVRTARWELGRRTTL